MEQEAAVERRGAKLATVELLAAALRPELEKNRSGWSYSGVELALGGAIDGGAAGVLRRLGKGVGEAKSGSARSSSASGFKGEKGFSTAARGFNLAALNRQWMRTSARGTAASSCVARRVAARAKAALPWRQSTPPAQHCSSAYPLEPNFVVLQISPEN
jgi:hypothetical protein